MEGRWDLVERAQQGDRDAFGELFRIHHAGVHRVATARLGRERADDATAEAFTRAWHALPRYQRTGAPFAAWLYAIARNVAIDTIRRDQRADHDADAIDDLAVDPWPSSDDRIRLYESLARLPEEQRLVIELKYLVGLSNEEVAAALGKRPGAVNAQQWRALRALERDMGER
ncbi:MAG: RNA polymerase sigma factor [Acidimicrobiales bacterium]